MNIITPYVIVGVSCLQVRVADSIMLGLKEIMYQSPEYFTGSNSAKGSALGHLPGSMNPEGGFRIL